MRRNQTLAIPLAGLVIAISAAATAAPITADATLELTFTLTDVTITDTLSGNTSSATFETSSEVGDLRFEDIGPNGATFADEGPANLPGSVGSASASESVSLNGLDPFVDDYDQDSFGIGDSLVTTMSAFASAETPGSVFFGQVNSDNTLYFSVYGEETDSYTFHFDYSAVLSGSLDSTALPGVTLALADGNEVSGAADATLAGPPNEFVVAMDYFSLGIFNGSGIMLPLDEMDSGSFDVAFDAGDDVLSITFLSKLVVNARPEAIPEPASLGLLALALLFPLALRIRN